MDLFIPSENKDSVIHYKLAEESWMEGIIRDTTGYLSYNKPTIIRKMFYTSDYSESTDKFYYSGVSDIYVLDYRGKDYAGKSLASNVGVACSGCDHYYEDAYEYRYGKNYLIKELASAIRCYFDTLRLNIASAQSNLNRIGDCLDCAHPDVYYMWQILESLSFDELDRFTSLDDLAHYILSSNSYDRAYNLSGYRKEIEGLDICDVCSDSTSEDSYTISTIKSKLCDYEKGRRLMDFLPEVREKEHELSRILVNRFRA